MSNRGLCIPGVPIIGNISAGGSTDLSDIDLTTPANDPRIDYIRAGSLSYWSADGTLQQAPANVWPLEYKDGVAVGRHEPEPQSTNLLKYARQLTGAGAGYYNTTFVDNAGIGLDGTQSATQVTATSTGGGAYSRHGGIIASAGEWVSFSLFYRRAANSVQVRTDIQDTVSALLDSNTFALTGSIVTGRDASYAVDEFEDWARVRLSLLLIANTTNLYVDFMRFHSGVAAEITTLVDFMQVEKSSIATSPILSAGAATVRATPFASVKNPGGYATAARIYYTDGTTYDIEFNGAKTGAIPPASKPWGTRYIEGVSYAKGFSR